MVEQIQAQKGPQSKFLSTSADVAFYGGAAGGGKSFALLLEPTRHIANKRFAGVIFRRKTPQITSPGALWDESVQLYSRINAFPRIGSLEWIFLSGSKIKFAHMEHESNKYDWQGSQIPFIGFDEVTQFSESQFIFMLSRNRSMSGVKGYIRATCNPDPDSFVARMNEWYINEEGFPIPERQGIIRWFIRQGEDFVWGSDKTELELANPGKKAKSFTFIASSVYDNKILLDKDPSYLANLMALPPIEQARLLEGNWKIRPTAGSYFKKSMFEMIDPEDLPARRQKVRYWDRAGTEKKSNNKPDWTAGVLLSSHNGTYYIEHVERFQKDASAVPELIKNIAKQDGHDTRVGIEQEPGASGKFEAQFYVKELAGYATEVLTPSADKVSRARPVASQAKAGNIKIVRGKWNADFLNELENFPIGAHDDQVDALSGAAAILMNKISGNFSDSHIGNQNNNTLIW
jgi:predicted phage terminase large subunit-like protein